MELYSILKFLENKSILVIGATGFLAKVLIEKILRVQPNIKKLYLLLRSVDSNSALHRFKIEVMGKELFKVLKEKYVANLDSFIAEKVVPVAGDITSENLGIENYIVLDEMLKQVELVINLAATTDFDQRYDVAFGINTIGPLRVLNFSRKCSKLRMLLHVSTAYVCGEKEGVILEMPFNMGDTLNNTQGLDVNVEKQVIQEMLKDVRAENGASEISISSIMKDLGVQRAKKFGWPNTYVFTKAMGEMVLGQSKEDNMPLVIIRPTIITSTYKEPFPGWVEGIRNIDSFIVGYGKGKMNSFPGDPQSVIDLIPADMVVNVMIVAMVAHANKPVHVIYHVGSSMANPVLYRSLQDYGLRYFRERPWINKRGKPVNVRKGVQLKNIPIVYIYLHIRYLIPLQMLNLANTASCQYFRNTYVDLSNKVKFLMRLVELFRPYVFFKGVFDDINTEKLRRTARENHEVENEMFYFDPNMINWDDYFMYTHIAGVVKHSFNR